MGLHVRKVCRSCGTISAKRRVKDCPRCGYYMTQDFTSVFVSAIEKNQEIGSSYYLQKLEAAQKHLFL